MLLTIMDLQLGKKKKVVKKCKYEDREHTNSIKVVILPVVQGVTEGISRPIFRNHIYSKIGR